jgi:hypothetical protein
MRLCDLARAAVAQTKEAFVSENPWPVFVVPDLEDSERCLVSLASVEPAMFRTTATRLSPLAFLREVYTSSLVVPLRKSSKNPFTALFFVGRAENNDLVIPHPTVSKSHAYISRRTDGQWIVQDTGSLNGLFLAGRRCPASTSRDLHDGVEIHFGTEVLVIFMLPAGLYDTARLLTTTRD